MNSPKGYFYNVYVLMCIKKQHFLQTNQVKTPSIQGILLSIGKITDNGKLIEFNIE